MISLKKLTFITNRFIFIYTCTLSTLFFHGGDIITILCMLFLLTKSTTIIQLVDTYMYNTLYYHTKSECTEDIWSKEFPLKIRFLILIIFSVII